MSGTDAEPVSDQKVTPSEKFETEVGVSTSLNPSALENVRRRVVGVDSTFDQSEDIRYYKPIETYEGLHRWDPEFEWDEKEEKKLVRKVSRTFLSLHSFCMDLPAC